MCHTPPAAASPPLLALLALLAVAPRRAAADYAQARFYAPADAQCSGSVVTEAVNLGGCLASTSGGSRLACINSTAWTTTYYMDTACGGSPLFTTTSVASGGCVTASPVLGGPSTLPAVTSCVAATFSMPAAPPAGFASQAAWSPGASCADITGGAPAFIYFTVKLGQCLPSDPPLSGVASCGATALTLAEFASTDCSGSSVSSRVLPLGCSVDEASGVATVALCSPDSPGGGANAGTGSAAASPAAIGGGIAGALLLAALAGLAWTGRLPWPGRAAKYSVSGGASLMGGSDRGAYGAVAA